MLKTFIIDFEKQVFANKNYKSLFSSKNFTVDLIIYYILMFLIRSKEKDFLHCRNALIYS